MRTTIQLTASEYSLYLQHTDTAYLSFWEGAKCSSETDKVRFKAQKVANMLQDTVSILSPQGNVLESFPPRKPYAWFYEGRHTQGGSK